MESHRDPQPPRRCEHPPNTHSTQTPLSPLISAAAWNRHAAPTEAKQQCQRRGHGTAHKAASPSHVCLPGTVSAGCVGRGGTRQPASPRTTSAGARCGPKLGAWWSHAAHRSHQGHAPCVQGTPGVRRLHQRRGQVTPPTRGACWSHAASEGHAGRGDASQSEEQGASEGHAGGGDVSQPEEQSPSRVPAGHTPHLKVTLVEGTRPSPRSRVPAGHNQRPKVMPVEGTRPSSRSRAQAGCLLVTHRI